MDSASLLSIIWELILILYGVTVIVTVCVIISENRSPVRALAWVTTLLVVPAVGLVLYFVFGRNIRSKRLMKRSQKRRLRQKSICKQLAFSRSTLSEDSHTLIRLATSLGALPAQVENNVELFCEGRAKFESLLADIAAAKHFIYIQYYIIADDDIGRKLCSALCKKAEEGVKVALIYDPVGSFQTKKEFFRTLASADVEVKPFIPVKFPAMGIRVNWRNHRKLCVIDGKIGYIGGMNVADRYVTGGADFDMWRDLHLKVTGPSVRSLEASFIYDWNFLGDDIEKLINNIPDSNARGTGKMVCQVVSSGPTGQWYSIELIFLKAISLAKKRVYIATPYFLPTEGLMSALQSASLSGVDVRIMVPVRSDSRLLTYATSSYVAECLRAGIKFYFFNPGMLHSKMLLIDDEITSVGSTNFDFRSFEHNFEGNMFVYDRDFNNVAANSFMADLKVSSRVHAGEWRSRSMMRKALESFTRLFAPIL